MGKEIGIDFGTTTTEVSYIDAKGRIRSLKLDSDSDIIPTVLYFKSKEEWIIGKKARKNGIMNPAACVRNFKLFLTDPVKRFDVKAENGDEFVIKPIKAAQLFINSLIQKIQAKLLKEFPEEGTIDKAVITVPAQFDPEEKAAIKDAIHRAATSAGFSDIKVAAEPTAAAIAYQNENSAEKETILVYDFGGGTFDVSVIKKDGDSYFEISTDGDKSLGGNRLTEKLAKVIWEWCCRKLKVDYPFEEDEFSEADCGITKQVFMLNKFYVFDAAEEIKLALSENDNAGNIFINFNAPDPKVLELNNYSRNDFNDIIWYDIEKTVELTERVFDKTLERSDISDISRIILVGGSSQIPLVKELLDKKNKFKGLMSPLMDSATLISKGAAKLASTELKVEEKTRFELGTKITRGVNSEFFKIIDAGENLPCCGKFEFFKTRQHQTEVSVEYYEKDVKNYPDARKIGDEGINLVNTLTISGIPDIPNWSMYVIFNIEVDGTPTITAEILNDSKQIIKTDQLSITKDGVLY